MIINISKKIFSALIVTLLVIPMLAQANVEESYDNVVYLNVDDISSQTIAIESHIELSNNWGSNWGDNIPFKGPVPHNIAALGSTNASVHLPKF